MSAPPYWRDVQQSALRERDAWKERAERAEAVVAVQREAREAVEPDIRKLLRVVDAIVLAGRMRISDASDVTALCILVEQLLDALDAEGVSEPGRQPQGSSEPLAGADPGSLTSPVDTAPRGYVEHGPGGPQAVYHAETPDAYLEHGDRP